MLGPDDQARASCGKIWRRIFQTEETASAKSPRQEQPGTPSVRKEARAARVGRRREWQGRSEK